jgi:hypothetical protein
MFYQMAKDDPKGPWLVYDRLRRECTEHSHLLEYDPPVGFLFREKRVFRNGRQVLGMCSMPSVNGSIRDLFDWMLAELLGCDPVFLFLFDAEFWRESGDLQREILMYHEMSHAQQKTDEGGAPRFSQHTGEPLWTIQGHDVEEFVGTVKRYGAWSPDLKRFMQAAGVPASLVKERMKAG